MKIIGTRGEAPAMRKIKNRYDWEYAEKWDFSVLTDEGLMRFVIDKGYRTDLASVPQALKGLMDNGSGDYGVLVAALWHDACYATKYVSKRLADDTFYLLLRQGGVGWFKAQCYYKAVYLFGDGAYEAENDELLLDRMLCKFYWTDK